MQNYDVKGRNQFFFNKKCLPSELFLICFEKFHFFLPAPFLLLAYSEYINVSNNDVVMHFRILWSFTKYTTPPPTVNIDDLTHSGKQ